MVNYHIQYIFVHTIKSKPAQNWLQRTWTDITHTNKVNLLKERITKPARWQIKREAQCIVTPLVKN